MKYLIAFPLLILAACTTLNVQPLNPQLSPTVPSPVISTSTAGQGAGDPLILFVCVPALNVRVGPDPSYIEAAALFEGDVVLVYEQQGDWSRIAPHEERWVWTACLCHGGRP